MSAPAPTPIPGDPDTVLRTAEALDDAARRWLDVHETIAGRGTALADAWREGVAGALAVARIRHDADLAGRAGDACRGAVAPLRAFAEELRRAQQDWADGAAMVESGQTASAGLGSAAPLEGPRDDAQAAVDDGANVMDTAVERARVANEEAARALRAAAAALAALNPAATAPQAGGGSFRTGLAKAGEDVVDANLAFLGGTADRLNPFSDRFAPAWAETWQQVSRPMDDPWTELAAAADATVAPIRESYRHGGIDEALGRSFGVLGEALAGKGLDKIGKLAKVGELGTAAKTGEAGEAVRPPLPPPDPNPGPRSAAVRGDHTPLAPGGGLAQHEFAGGHTLDPDKAHVGGDPAAMLDRLASEPDLGRVSSFFDQDTAERSVRENIVGNRESIQEWLATSPAKPKGFNWEHDFDTGPSIARKTAPAINVARRSRVVLFPDPNRPDGYFVYTSYPKP